MKTKVIVIACFCLGIVTFCSSCNGNVVEDEEPQPSVLIIKFKDPAYRNNLIVSNYDDKGVFILMRGNLCERTYFATWPSLCPELHRSLDDIIAWYDSLERVRDPFWELPQGWFLIDWAWFGLDGFPYPYTGNTVLSDFTYDNYMENGSCFFDKSLPHITKDRNDLYELRMINVADLMAYTTPNGEYPTFTLHSWDVVRGIDTIVEYSNQYFYHSVLRQLHPVSNETHCLCGMADEMDSYWAYVQNQLSDLINNGDLDKLPRFDINKLYENIER